MYRRPALPATFPRMREAAEGVAAGLRARVVGLGPDAAAAVSAFDGVVSAVGGAGPEAHPDAGAREDAARRVIAALSHARRAVDDLRRHLRPWAVFFPYKASMWDSLESVWQAAVDDPAWDAEVIPAPYDELGPDQQPRHPRWEGDLFPDRVPVTDPSTVDLEWERPTIAFVHNPYDARNLITRVDPRFFAENLRTVTGTLVYVPYYVVSEDYVYSDSFWLTAGTLFSDLVAVQSPAQAEEYVEVFARGYAAAGRPFSRRVLEAKFQALGSPKLDRVVAPRPEDRAVPEAWETLLRRSVPARPTVVLYATSIAALLEGDEAVVDQLRATCALAAAREDVVLWWRPHPLGAAAYDAMRPGIARAYQEVLEEFRASGRGILDDTAELHRALTCTDAYLGDPSSLVPLYQHSGKPVMRQPDARGDWRSGVSTGAVTEVGESAGSTVSDLTYRARTLGDVAEYLDLVADPERAEDLAAVNSVRATRAASVVAHGDGTAGAAVWRAARTRAGRV